MNDKTSEYQQVDCILHIKLLNCSDANIWNIWNLFVVGTQTFPNRSFWWVDARDVVNVHIQAYEIREASGKYCSVLVCAIITSKWDQFKSIGFIEEHLPFCFPLNNYVFVNLHATISGEEIRKKNKKHIDLMWFDGLPTLTRTGKKTFTISQFGLHKIVFILTLRYWNSKSTPKPNRKGRCPPHLPTYHSPLTIKIQAWMTNVIALLRHLPLFLHMSFTQYEPHTTTVLVSCIN